MNIIPNPYDFHGNNFFFPKNVLKNILATLFNQMKKYYNYFEDI